MSRQIEIAWLCFSIKQIRWKRITIGIWNLEVRGVGPWKNTCFILCGERNLKISLLLRETSVELWLRVNSWSLSFPMQFYPSKAGTTAQKHSHLVMLNCCYFRIWTMSDVNKDGMLNSDEFCLAKFLLEEKLQGRDLPRELPNFLLPPIPSDEEEASSVSHW